MHITPYLENTSALTPRKAQELVDQLVKKVTDEINGSDLPGFEGIDYLVGKTLNQILADNRISDSEKAMIRKLMENNTTTDTTENQNLATQLLVNQLASCDDSHPYAPFYHFFKGHCDFLVANEDAANKGSIREEHYEKLREAIKEFDQTIYLNPDFAEAYYLRGILHSFLGTDEQAFADIRSAVAKGSEDAQKFLNRLLQNQ